MARRGGTRVRRFGRRATRGLNTNALLAGTVAGAAAPFATNFLGDWGTPVALGATGVFMKNDTLQTLAGLSVGSRLIGGAGIAGTATRPEGLL